MRIWRSSDYTSNILRAGRSGYRIPGGATYFPLFKSNVPAVGLTYPPVQKVPGMYFSVKTAGA
jgi:hypothetical protein